MALIGGLILSVALTKLFNWYTWGENKYKKDALEHRIKARKAKREKENDDKNGS